MKRKPSTEATAAWIRLMRVQGRVLDAVEQDSRRACSPPLAWYDALLELSRAPSGEMRPVELEKQMLIPQYSTSRLIDRLVDEGLAARRECEVDKRGQFVEITEAGRELHRKMWSADSAAIENCGAVILPRLKGVWGQSCPMGRPGGSAVCSTGWPARAMRLNRPPQQET